MKDDPVTCHGVLEYPSPRDDEHSPENISEPGNIPLKLKRQTHDNVHNKGQGYLYFESRRDSVTQPGVANATPGDGQKNIQPQRGCGNCVIEDAATHSGLMGMGDARYPGWPFGQPWALIHQRVGRRHKPPPPRCSDGVNSPYLPA
jgi:hypothetical protein